jgi:predicted metal-binding membrane protein
MADSRALEGLLRRRRLVTAGALAVLCALAWAYLLNGAGLGMSPWAMTRLSLFPHPPTAGMPGMDMPGMDMGGMELGAPAWTPAVWALTIGMWWSMMVAMMTPAAAPTILLYGQVRRHAEGRGQGDGLASSGAFTAGYLLVWLGFSLAAAGLQWALQRDALLSAATMGSQSRWLSAAVLVAAGLYQLSPLQDRCLSHCRSPAGFLSRHWRPGALGAVRLGAMHGAYCVGCCWLLMGLLFVGGVMNLVWIAVLTLLVLAQKLVPGGVWVGRAAGVALLAWGLATLVV